MDIKVDTALCQFIFPFSFRKGCQKDLKSTLKEDGYKPFFLNDLEVQNAYYGSDYCVNHLSMERYYLPFTANVLFPHHEQKEAIQRYSKKIELSCTLSTRNYRIPFIIHSLDVFVCPFDLGFITIRTQVDDIDFSLALEFANSFRVLQDITDADNATFVVHDRIEYKEVESFIFKKLAVSILPYLDKSGMEGAYFETLPFFVDERMYVVGTFMLEKGSSITEHDLFRASHLNGIDSSGNPFISASDSEYISKYINDHSYRRWAPNTYYVTSEHTFSCIMNVEEEALRRTLANQMYGEYYYGLMLNLFHKIVLLKLSNLYSTVNLVRDTEEISSLISSITTFSSKYFFLELVSQAQGREIFVQLRKVFGNNGLYNDVKQTLTDLFKYQDTFSSRKQNYLLMVLTLYTVVGGIYGMNHVIDDLKGEIDWHVLRNYSFFEWVAFFITMTGLLVGFSLGIRVVLNLIKEWRRKRI